MPARKLVLLPEEREELVTLFNTLTSSDEEVIALTKAMIETSKWGERNELLNPKYTTWIVHIQKYQNDVLKIAYSFNGKKIFGDESKPEIRQLFSKWIEGDENIYVGQEFEENV